MPNPAPYSNQTTSKAAAKEIEPRLNDLELQVLDRITAGGRVGATCWEVERDTGLSHQTASARIRELWLKRRIEASGETRITNSRRGAKVWVLPKYAPPRIESAVTPGAMSAIPAQVPQEPGLPPAQVKAALSPLRRMLEEIPSNASAVLQYDASTISSRSITLTPFDIQRLKELWYYPA